MRRSAIPLWHAFDDEMPTVVSARYAKHRLFLKDRVRLVGVKSDEYAFDRLQVLGLQHIAGHLHGVDMVASGECVGIIAERIALVVVGDGIRKINRVGGIGLQRVLQLHGDSLSIGFDFWSLQLRWRYNDFLCGVVEFDKLIEEDAYFPTVDVG